MAPTSTSPHSDPHSTNLGSGLSPASPFKSAPSLWAEVQAPHWGPRLTASASASASCWGSLVPLPPGCSLAAPLWVPQAARPLAPTGRPHASLLPEMHSLSPSLERAPHAFQEAFSEPADHRSFLWVCSLPLPWPASLPSSALADKLPAPSPEP